jgi:hypothetical protein
MEVQMARSIQVLALVALLAPATALAEGRGFGLGARLGIGFAGGEYGGADGGLAGYLDQALVVGVDAGLEVAPAVEVGAFVTLQRPRFDTNKAVGSVPQVTLASPVSSSYRLEGSALDLQLGLRAQVGMGDAKVAGIAARPWGAVYAGWERLALDFDGTKVTGTGPDSISPSKTYTGFVGGLEGGVEVPVGTSLTVGPYVGFTFGKFRSVETDGTGVTTTGTTLSSWFDRTLDYDPGQRAVHTWTSIGLRGRFGL